MCCFLTAGAPIAVLHPSGAAAAHAWQHFWRKCTCSYIRLLWGWKAFRNNRASERNSSADPPFILLSFSCINPFLLVIRGAGKAFSRQSQQCHTSWRCPLVVVFRNTVAWMVGKRTQTWSSRNLWEGLLGILTRPITEFVRSYWLERSCQSTPRRLLLSELLSAAEGVLEYGCLLTRTETARKSAKENLLFYKILFLLLLFWLLLLLLLLVRIIKKFSNFWYWFSYTDQSSSAFQTVENTVDTWSQTIH